jgi:hypothetical protein
MYHSQHRSTLSLKSFINQSKNIFFLRKIPSPDLYLIWSKLKIKEKLRFSSNSHLTWCLFMIIYTFQRLCCHFQHHQPLIHNYTTLTQTIEFNLKKIHNLIIAIIYLASKLEVSKKQNGRKTQFLHFLLPLPLCFQTSPTSYHSWKITYSHLIFSQSSTYYV